MPGGALGADADTFGFDRLALYVSPLLNGPPYNNVFAGFAGEAGLRGYFGAAVAAFALAATCDFRKRSKRLSAFPKNTFAFVSMFLIAKRFGMPIVSLIGLMPGFKRVIMYKYDEPVLGFCIAVLAAYGVQRFSQRRSPSWPLVTGVGGVLSLLSAVAIIDRRRIVEATPHIGYFAASVSFALAMLATLIVLVLVKARARYSATSFSCALVAAVACSVIVPYIVPMYYLVDRSASRSASTLFGAPYVFEARRELADGRRFFSPESLLYPDWGTPFAIADPRDVDALYPERYLPFLRAFLRSEQNYFLTDRFVSVDAMDFSDPLVRHWMQLSAVGIVAVERSFKGIDRYPIAYRDSRVRLHRVSGSLSLLSAFASVRRVGSKEAALSALTRSDFDPTKSVVVEATGAPEPQASPAAFAPLAIEQRTPTSLRSSITLARPAMVLDDETNFPGWKALVDGRPVPIYAADYLFRAIAVPAGHHAIEFRYESKAVTLGATITGIAMIVTVGFFAISFVRAGRSASRQKR